MGKPVRRNCFHHRSRQSRNAAGLRIAEIADMRLPDHIRGNRGRGAPIRIPAVGIGTRQINHHAATAVGARRAGPGVGAASHGAVREFNEIIAYHKKFSVPYIEFNRCFAAYALSTILVPVGFPLSSRQERCRLKIYLAYVLPSQLRLSRILLGACERALILPTSAGEASPPPVLRRTCRCSIPHSTRKLQNPHLLTRLHAS